MPRVIKLYEKGTTKKGGVKEAADGFLGNKKPHRKSVGSWLRHKDSNPDKLIQSQSCYRYTMSQCALIIITDISNMSRVLFDFLTKIIYTYLSN